MQYQPGSYPPPVPPVQPTNSVAVPWYHKKWFVVVMMLIFPPIGLALLWSSPLTQKSGRIAWTVFASLVFIGLVAKGPSDPRDTPTADIPVPVNKQTDVASPASTSTTQPPATTAPPQPTAPTKAEPTWQVVKRWTGSGTKETETFTVASREWRITWKTTNEQVAGVFQIFVYDENGSLVSLAANQMGVGGDTSYVRGKAGGRYYLTINSANLDWEVVVEDQR